MRDWKVAVAGVCGFAVSVGCGATAGSKMDPVMSQVLASDEIRNSAVVTLEGDEDCKLHGVGSFVAGNGGATAILKLEQAPPGRYTFSLVDANNALAFRHGKGHGGQNGQAIAEMEVGNTYRSTVTANLPGWAVGGQGGQDVVGKAVVVARVPGTSGAQEAAHEGGHGETHAELPCGATGVVNR